MNTDTPYYIIPWWIDYKMVSPQTLKVTASFDGKPNQREKFYLGIATRVDSFEPEKAICVWREEIEVVMPDEEVIVSTTADFSVHVPIDAITPEARRDCHLMVFDNTGRWIYGRKIDLFDNL